MALALIRLLVNLLSRHGISKGTRLAKNLGFKNKHISEASKKFLKRLKRMPKKNTKTLYRGYPEWYRGTMVKEGTFIGGEGSAVGARFAGMFKNPPKIGSLYATTNKNFAKKYASKNIDKAMSQYNLLKSKGWAPTKQMSLLEKVQKGQGPVLEFRVPKTYLSNYGTKSRRIINIADTPNIKGTTYAFPEGIPKEFLKKVHK
jgi:hypothetical protein